MSIRLRLALIYAGAIAAVLIPASLLAFALHVRSQYQDLDKSLLTAAEHFQDELLTAAKSGAGPVLAVQSDVSVALYGPDAQPIAGGSPAGGVALSPTQVIARNDGPAYSALVSWLPGSGEPSGSGAFATARDAGSGHRLSLYALPVVGSDAGGYVLTWKSLAELDASARFLALILGAVTIGAVVAVGSGAYAVTGNVLRPVAEMTATARGIATARSFSRRVEEPARLDELGRLAQTFNEMLSSLEDAYRLEQRFVADAAHELRAPLTAIEGNIELLKRHPDMSADERAEAFAYLEGESRRLARIVGELLTLARADAGQTLVRRPVELDRVLLDAVGELNPIASGHRLELDGLEPAEVSGDPDRLKELVVNLIDNGIKYTPAGGRIGVALTSESETAVLTVKDAGIGIGTDDLAHVFERFYRGDSARSRDPGGSGLGLPIVRWIVDQHEGEIIVSSTPGIYSRWAETEPFGM